MTSTTEAHSDHLRALYPDAGNLLDQIPTSCATEGIEGLSRDIRVSEKQITTPTRAVGGAMTNSQEMTPLCVKALDVIGQLFGSWQNKSIG